MEEPKRGAHHDDQEFHDALDEFDQEGCHAINDFTFYDAFEAFSQPMKPRMSSQSENPNSSPADKDLPRPGLRRRSGADSTEPSKISSQVNSENYPRERKLVNSRKTKECAAELVNSAPLETKFRSNAPESSLIGEKDEKKEQPSTVTNVNADDYTNANATDNTRVDDSSLPDNQDTNSSLVLTLAVLVGLLMSAFVMSGILIKAMVEEPTRIQRNLNFDYKGRSLVAYVPIETGPKLTHDMYLGENLNNGKASGSRVIPPNHDINVTVSLTLPESEYNLNLGIFQVGVDFLAADGQILAMLRRPCMLHSRSLPIRFLLTLVKLAPILTWYTSETHNLNINFRGFRVGQKPTANLRVVIEPRAEFSPGDGIPEIYSAFFTLESELPPMKRELWFWKKLLFVWISIVIFTMELFLAILCCRPIVKPIIRLREAANRDGA